MARPFFTIGHSNRSLETFIDLLTETEIELVADIRTVPRSRANPQFNTDVLPEHLASSEIGYEHMAALGGLRGKARSLPPDVNGLWENQSFHNYADYALSDRFQTGFQHLRNEGHRLRCALMCSEAVWWRCHRRIVADYLIAAGETVFHIMERGRIETARLTQGAVILADGRVTYPAVPDLVPE